MKSWKIIIVFVNVLFVIFLCCCALDPIILPGDISGIVTDAETSQPLDSTSVDLNQSNDLIENTTTGGNGSYLFKKVEPGKYEITAFKPRYERITQEVEVKSASIEEVDFALNNAPYPDISVSHLDFSDEFSQKSFTIKNVGAGKLSYHLYSAQDWITINPESGDATTETDTINVTINRSIIADKIQEEIISIISYSGPETIYDTIDVFANGVIDQDGQYYNIVKIGSQTWMAENLNTGKMINFFDGALGPEDNGTIEKYCYGNSVNNCGIYGGLYTWHEMMDYIPLDEGIFDEDHLFYRYNAQGICPAGWHIPTYDDWETLMDYVGASTPGVTLKDTSPLWKSDTIATNESGFSALPGGSLSYHPDVNDALDYNGKGVNFFMWEAATHSDQIQGHYHLIYENEPTVYNSNMNLTYSNSVRCIKDP